MIKKGVRHGAVDLLVKPVNLCEIMNIRQQVYRKNLPTNTCKHDDYDDNNDNDVGGLNVAHKNKKSGRRRKKSSDAIRGSFVKGKNSMDSTST